MWRCVIPVYALNSSRTAVFEKYVRRFVIWKTNDACREGWVSLKPRPQTLRSSSPILKLLFPHYLIAHSEHEGLASVDYTIKAASLYSRCTFRLHYDFMTWIRGDHHSCNTWFVHEFQLFQFVIHQHITETLYGKAQS